ncbi:MAG TPA: dienelactone hydrolase family protein [Stellaceae bacterium]|nr:dienelactone hydrolase family protein [Stellaceae bacterium]
MKTETIEYRSGALTMHAYVAYDEKKSGKRPGVLVCHDIFGLSDDPKRRAHMLADLGYFACAVDMYGGGKIPKDFPEGMGLLMPLLNDRAELRRRVNAALEAMNKRPEVDAGRTGAIGYCFGGSTVLELARSGANVRGVVSFHGGLSSPTPADAKNIKGQVLVCHGADDPLVPPPEVDGFIKEMKDGGCNWELIHYGNTVHAFTNPANDGKANPAAKYNAKADKHSWESMKELFGEIFA